MQIGERKLSRTNQRVDSAILIFNIRNIIILSERPGFLCYRRYGRPIAVRASVYRGRVREEFPINLAAQAEDWRLGEEVRWHS